MNVMTKGEMANHLRSLVADAPSFAIEHREKIRSIADELDPPKPKIDRSVRGFVHLQFESGVTKRAIAVEDGLHTGHALWWWDEAEKAGITVTPIRELKPGQVAMDISTLRYLVRVAEESMFHISEHFDRSVAVSDAKNAIAEAARLEHEQ